jgi:MmyB-like transcription regulator ligand binding domain
VRRHAGGDKGFRHLAVGRLDLTWDSMDLVAAPGLVLTAYTAEPATASADSLALLATWAATEAIAADPHDATTTQAVIPNTQRTEQ